MVFASLSCSSFCCCINIIIGDCVFGVPDLDVDKNGIDVDGDDENIDDGDDGFSKDDDVYDNNGCDCADADDDRICTDENGDDDVGDDDDVF